MKLSFHVPAICSFVGVVISQQSDQAILYADERKIVRNIAIIGAGAGGASAAYHLSRFATNASIAVDITVFERNDYIGGRSTTVNAYDDASIPVELGASIFVEINHILNNAVKEFNLSTAEFIPQAEVPGAGLGVWDGQEFVITQNGKNGWWDTAKLLWKYGLAPIKTMRLMRKVVNKFLSMYEEPAFPFESLTQVAQDVGLLAVTAATGKQYLEENGITGDFGHDIVQASTRVNYAQNLKYIHGLEAMVCMAAENAQSVHRGNWQIFDRMIKASGAKIGLGHEVTAIQRSEGSEKFELVVRDPEPFTESALREHGYDEVIIATPLQYSNISFFDPKPKVDKIPYVQLHVTLFASPHLLSPTYFNMASDEAVPRVILTTLPKGEKAKEGSESVGSPGFFSISLLDPVTNPETGGTEYLYKIFSPSAPNSTFLSNILALKLSSDDADISDKDISWIHRKVWNSYPYEYPRVTFEKIRLEGGLWYTSGMDSFISTMETNALMGKNVAKLMVDNWMKKTEGEESVGGIVTPTLLP